MTNTTEKPHNTPITRDTSAPPQPLRESAHHSISYYLAELDGESCSGLYDMVISQVEQPLLAAIMRYTQGNQSKASAMLGLNRGTLRKKLRQYGLLDLPGA